MFFYSFHFILSFNYLLFNFSFKRSLYLFDISIFKLYCSSVHSPFGSFFLGITTNRNITNSFKGIRSSSSIFSITIFPTVSKIFFRLLCVIRIPFDLFLFRQPIIFIKSLSTYFIIAYCLATSCQLGTKLLYSFFWSEKGRVLHASSVFVATNTILLVGAAPQSPFTSQVMQPFWWFLP